MRNYPFTMYRWCGFHNLPMSICDQTSSMRCWNNFVEKCYFIHEFLWDKDKNELNDTEEKLELMRKHLEKCKVKIEIIDD